MTVGRDAGLSCPEGRTVAAGSNTEIALMRTSAHGRQRSGYQDARR